VTRLLVVAALLAFVAPARAHEVRPAYLEIDESAPGRYALLWRTPLQRDQRLPVVLRLPDGARDLHEPLVEALDDSALERRAITTDDAGRPGLAGRRITFLGLQGTITDVLVRVSLLDGSRSATLVHPSQPWVEIIGSRGMLAVVRAYLAHGVEHILFGFDHLLFVLALILIVRSRRMLLLTISAFTVAHSVTLALATLGVVHVPGPPVEATIALSILLLAVEIVQLQRGQRGLTARRPWLVAFSFGLLHGFGFASALSEIGLPRSDIPLALLSFNVGVECGQLLFVAFVLGTAALARRLRLAPRLQRYARHAAPYAIGALATFWLLDRLTRF
jgi:hydrogenase/urease accessory protein HupE